MRAPSRPPTRSRRRARRPSASHPPPAPLILSPRTPARAAWINRRKRTPRGVKRGEYSTESRTPIAIPSEGSGNRNPLPSREGAGGGHAPLLLRPVRGIPEIGIPGREVDAGQTLRVGPQSLAG